MTEAEKRLAAAVAAWAKAEIEHGYTVHPHHSVCAYETFGRGEFAYRAMHVAFCCGGVKPHGEKMTGHQASIEACGRFLVWRVRMAAIERDLRPDTHQILWRDLPEIDEEAWLSEYLPSLNAYCRLSFVPLDAGERVPHEYETEA